MSTEGTECRRGAQAYSCTSALGSKPAFARLLVAGGVRVFGGLLVVVGLLASVLVAVALSGGGVSAQTTTSLPINAGGVSIGITVQWDPIGNCDQPGSANAISAGGDYTISSLRLDCSWTVQFTATAGCLVLVQPRKEDDSTFKNVDGEDIEFFQRIALVSQAGSDRLHLDHPEVVGSETEVHSLELSRDESNALTCPFQMLMPDPSFTISVPDRDINGDNDNDFIGASFSVSYYGGNQRGCSGHDPNRNVQDPQVGSQNVTVTVDDSGNAMATGPTVLQYSFNDLYGQTFYHIGEPGNKDDQVHRCSYAITWPPEVAFSQASASLVLVPTGATAAVGGEPSVTMASATYEALPNINLRNTTSGSDSSDMVRAGFTPVDNCVAEHGPSSTVDIPSGSAVRQLGALSVECDWELSWWNVGDASSGFYCDVDASVIGVNESVIGDVLSVNSELVLRGDVSERVLRYGSGDGEVVVRVDFEVSDAGCTEAIMPSVSIMTPDVPAGEESLSAGAQIELVFSPTDNSHSDCGALDSPYVAGAERAILYTVQVNGDVTQTATDGGDIELTSRLPFHINTQERCVYDVVFQEVTEELVGGGGVLYLVESSPATVGDDTGLLTPQVSAVYSYEPPSSLPSVGLRNRHVLVAGESGNDRFEQVRVVVSPLSGCVAGARSPIGSGEYILDAQGDDEITGLLSTSCNWRVSFSHVAGACQVSAQVRNSIEGEIGDAVTSGSLTLSGIGGQTGLLYEGQEGGTVVSGNAAFIDFDISADTCASVFSPSASIVVPVAPVDDFGVNVYSGVEIVASYVSSRAGCTSGSGAEAVYVVADDGSVDLRGGERAPILVHQALTDLGKSVASNRCVYDVKFTEEAGSLRLAPGATESVVGGDEVVADSDVEVSAVYEVALVNIVVSSALPSDRLYTTKERVGFSVDVLPPCGGTLAFLPGGLASQGRYAEVQAFPGVVFVFSPEVNILLNSARVYTMPAYADAKGEVPCSAQVTQVEVPEGCVPVSGSSQTKTYTGESNTLDFRFEHDCNGDSTTTATTPPTPGGGASTGPEQEKPAG